jgi:exosome complex component RRP40
MKVILPGDAINASSYPIGNGIWSQNDHLIAIQYGFLRTGPIVDVLHPTKKSYLPLEKDKVIGIIKEKHGESYIVDINCYQDAYLPLDAFEHIEKYRSQLNVGSLIYAQVVSAHLDMDIQLTCVTDSPEGLGILSRGTMMSCSLRLAQQLFHKGLVLEELGTLLSYEIAIGLNGRIWINATNIETIRCIAHVIKKSEKLKTRIQLQQMISSLWNQMIQD